MIDYRSAHEADAGAISNLFADSFSDTFGRLYAPADLAEFLALLSPAAFAREIADPAYGFHVAEEGSAMIGFIKLGPSNLPIETPPDTIELRQLYLTPAAKGRGVGDALIDWGLAEARRRGMGHIQLSVYVDNHRARRFYEKYGFVEIGAYRFKVGDHIDDDRIMRAQL